MRHPEANESGRAAHLEMLKQRAQLFPQLRPVLRCEDSTKGGIKHVLATSQRHHEALYAAFMQATGE